MRSENLRRSLDRLSAVSTDSLGCLDVLGSTAGASRHPQLETEANRELKQRGRQRQRERHKTMGLMSKNNHSARAFYSFEHFVAVLCKTTT